MRARAGPLGLAIGVDAGGTWLRIQAFDGRRRVATIRRAAPARADLVTSLGELWRRRGWTRRAVAALVVASRGVWTVPERRQLERQLAGLAQRVRVVSDAEAAFLGALGARPGILIVAGTGSIVVGRNARGRWAREGGLGPLLGDEGSAFWIGRAWVRTCSRGTNGLDARRLATSPHAVARIAALAPRIVARARSGERGPRAIVREAQAALARMTLDVARRLGLVPPVSVSWGGGVADVAWYRAGIRRALAHTGLGARWVAPREPAVASAAALARALRTTARRRRR